KLEVELATAVANLSAAAIASADAFDAQTRLYAQVQASEELFARFMQQLPGLAWVKDLEGRYVYANDTALAAFGSTRPQFYGRTDDDLFPPQTAAQFKENDQKALASATGVQVVESLKHEDGVVHSSIVSKFPIPGHDGQTALVGGMAIDITEHKRAEDDARFLADASAALAGLVDYKSTLQKVARLAVPTFADWCAVDMLDADGTLERLAVAHVDPAKVELARELYRRYPPDPSSPGGVWKIIRRGRSTITPEISDERLAANIKDPDYLRVVREVGLKSYMGVPLKIREKVVGAIMFLSAES
ncbi:MAG TPA: PAS domain-containing protein, partial [Pirellulales bacterium]|nr:PAS domain-containing protein [Pirellulales bacterium]